MSELYDNQSHRVLEVARNYVSAGFSVIPVRIGGTKVPAVESWRPFQSRPPKEDELPSLFDRKVGVAIVCGKVSGGLEVIDVDDPGFVDPLANAIQDRFLESSSLRAHRRRGWLCQK